MLFKLLCCHLQPDKVKFQLRLGQSKPIYNAFKAIQESPNFQTLSDARKRIVESEYFLHFILLSIAKCTQICTHVAVTIIKLCR